VTSPPYWGLRDYGVTGQLGLEPTPDAYVARLVEVFREVRRVLADDGTLWLNLGDSYAASNASGAQGTTGQRATRTFTARTTPKMADGLKPKDLVGIPWRVAFALQADGWYLRSDIIWSKPNPMPESVTDRPTKAHEYVFLLSKSERYYYDADAIAEPVTCPDPRMVDGFVPKSVHGKHSEDKQNSAHRKQDWTGNPTYTGFNGRWSSVEHPPTRNARTVWTIPTSPYPGAHFATFPEELARRCILAGSETGDIVLDPFGGSGTVASIATGNGRGAIYIDLNPEYVNLAVERIGPMLCGPNA
jgi:DNA modification methylase